MSKKRFEMVYFDEVPGVQCPCGTAKRAFRESGSPASMHMVTIETDAKTHYHRHTTEIYYVLEGKGDLEVDGERVPLRPGSAVLIRPGCRHRAVGNLKIINVAIPVFDPADEHFD